ncbi:MAG: hypothetical protein O3C53_04410 [Bacteroidetes bacterium]|nr:hypothetical protein [Bacteroidota bacterium]MDA1318409.1 hypothetical protein [Bacteroidota bacterium]MDA8531501.1 hypothetical protein [Flavobacteriaceae bacterium]
MKFLSLFSVLLFSFTLYLVPTEDNVVEVSGRQLIVDNTPYFMKGVCYHPVLRGETERNFSTIDQDLELISEAGINTIRVYAPIDDIEVLDKIDAAGLKLIVSFGYNQNGVYDILSGTFLDYIMKYKDHNSILIWELGNEYNYHPEWFGGDIQNWYNALSQATDQIHDIDPNHPVATAHGDMPDKQALASNPNIDIWGLNVYRWDQPQSVFKEWQTVSDKPVYLSEAGADSYMKISKAGFEQGENQRAQAVANAKIIDAVLDRSDVASGIFIFSFTDGLWKAGNPNQQDIGGWAPNSSGVPYDGAPNEEYWGIVDINRTKKETFEVIKERFVNFSLPSK